MYSPSLSLTAAITGCDAIGGSEYLANSAPPYAKQIVQTLDKSSLSMSSNISSSPINGATIELFSCRQAAIKADCKLALCGASINRGLLFE